MPQIVITAGQACVMGNGLRCMATPDAASPRRCNKLVAKKNSAGALAGSFQCPDRRCRQSIEVETRL